ncbi:hypothetical protein BTR23_23995 [Alkalihalophilus pseudofirmus]|uniref:DUF421 domain-containing protein n=1 Tax=Alkalihalobacterium alkalinitrilicum TaxID=427920 RepID=UPI00094DD779|nr:DUF421 domain-containing protein [Alkalihalobacterium alkalinitrilicum]OLO26124.1 hypothetical protein BTR23_23995 [Alkalihalophilus pseudofirmus]
MAEHIEVIIRSIMAFTILLIGARLLGKQLISQMNTMDFIAAISLGSITANLAFNTTIAIHHFLLAFFIFIFVSLVTAFISMKNRKARKFFAGDPTILIQNGRVLEANMRKMRYTFDYLNQQLRERDVFNIEEVLFAIIEPNGTLTVLKKPQYRTVTKQDLNLPAPPETKLPIELIMDGEILEKNLQENDLSHCWLASEVKKRNYSLNDVAYAVLSPNGNVYIDTYRDHIVSPIDKE